MNAKQALINACMLVYFTPALTNLILEYYDRYSLGNWYQPSPLHETTNKKGRQKLKKTHKLLNKCEPFKILCSKLSIDFQKETCIEYMIRNIYQKLSVCGSYGQCMATPKPLYGYVCLDEMNNPIYRCRHCYFSDDLIVIRYDDTAHFWMIKTRF